MAEERLILDERVFPELKKFCREQNFDVHIVDVNIGDEQFNYDDWKDEIKMAHHESTGVGFIVSLWNGHPCICSLQRQKQLH